MGLEQKIQLKLSQKLVMTQALQQAIKLLQMTRMELQEVVAQELTENPLLEESSDEEGKPEEVEAENEARKKAFADWCVDTDMMQAAKPDALFMHCLPAHRGEEVEAEVIDGPQSVVWDEAENRMHAQKALMEYLLLGKL